MGPDRVSVRLSYWPDGVLKSVEALGHAGTAPAGSNVACAALTVLVRTAYETIAGYAGVSVHGKASMPGQLGFEVGPYPPAVVDRLKGVGDYLLVGISSVEREFPGLIEMKIES